ncbi:MAG TPA: prolyl oligopeptidase family serine peptidase [Cyclobacteriaceae bacterium]|nr:prolyl oligopeptidase family serine peptidase [Cyclobacteriaceae bacterium]
MKKILSLIVLAVLVISCSEKKTEAINTVYPATKKVDTIDNYFGVKINDPYRWLENDTTKETAEWVRSENEVTTRYLDHIPYRADVKARLEKLWNYPKFSAPFKAGNRYFFSKNDGLQNQAVLYMQKDLNAEPEVVLDPNAWTKDGTIALSGSSVSKDGKYLAFSTAESGSDWNKIMVMNLDTKQLTGDTVRRVKFSGISWRGNGFYYSGYPKPKGSELSTKNEFHTIFYHNLGDNQSKDQLVYKDPSAPLRNFYAQTTEDERFLVVYGSEGTSGNNLRVKDLGKSGSSFITVVDDFKQDHTVVEADGSDLLLMTNLNAPNKRIVRVNLAKPTAESWKDIIAENDSRIQGANIINGKLFVEYLKDASDRVYRHSLTGEREAEVNLPGIGSVGFGGSKVDKEIFYTFVSFTTPTSIYRYNVVDNKSELFRKPEIDFVSDDYETKQVFYESKDGTKVPMFIVHKKGITLDGKNPTWLYSYGGFDISMTPSFSVSRLVWLENGGVYAQPSIRGGGEYGEKWHKGGMLQNKQNVFDDFIAAAEYLIKEKYTSSAKLAIAGGSNGGLLVGATMTQRPDLMKVAFPAVGVMDMLRYEKFTIGWAWATEFGSVKDSASFQNILAYSPLHNLKAGVSYPATMVTTADHDDRVVPAHSFKFAATLQASQAGTNPVLIRIETKAGHGAGKPTAKIIQEQADLYSFAWYNMGVVPPMVKKSM